MYKTETHLHLAEVSNCGKLKAPEMMKLYAEAGYTTVFVSDHFFYRYFENLGDIPWEDKITIFLSGYYKAKHAGAQYGLNVLLAAEMCFEGVDGHFLTYGIDREFLNAHPNICKYSLEEFHETALQNGILTVQAHPYRDGHDHAVSAGVDGIEVYNSNPRHDDRNNMAMEYAQKNGLYMTAGSDAHRYEDVAGSAILTETPITTAEEFINIIKSGSYTIYPEDNK